MRLLTRKRATFVERPRCARVRSRETNSSSRTEVLFLLKLDRSSRADASATLLDDFLRHMSILLAVYASRIARSSSPRDELTGVDSRSASRSRLYGYRPAFVHRMTGLHLGGQNSVAEKGASQFLSHSLILGGERVAS